MYSRRARDKGNPQTHATQGARKESKRCGCGLTRAGPITYSAAFLKSVRQIEIRCCCLWMRISRTAHPRMHRGRPISVESSSFARKTTRCLRREAPSPKSVSPKRRAVHVVLLRAEAPYLLRSTWGGRGRRRLSFPTDKWRQLSGKDACVPWIRNWPAKV